MEKGQLLDWKAYKLVPKGGGEEQGMRGGMSQFLATAGVGKKVGSTTVASRGGRSVDRGKGKTRAEVVDVSDEEVSAGQQMPIVQPVPRKLRFDAIPEVMDSFANNSAAGPGDPVAKDKETATDHPTHSPDTFPQPLEPAIKESAPITPTKHLTHLAPVFAGKSPNSIRQIVAPNKGQSVGMTSDPLTFAHAAAMGYAKNAENVDAKRLMQKAEWREQHTAANEGFLEGYYQNSR